MARPPVTWLITDTHFNHKLIVESGDRPSNHGALLVGNCRGLISQQDTTYHLGDVMFNELSTLKSLLDAIPGRKILVRGNHDHKTNGWYERNGFHFVADYIALGNVILSHKPLESFPERVEYNIHGHQHNDAHRLAESAHFYDPTRHFKLALEDVGYKPVQMQEFLARHRQL